MLFYTLDIVISQDAELLTFLLQLVQALRYEPFSASSSNRAVDFPLEVSHPVPIIPLIMLDPYDLPGLYHGCQP